MQEPNVESANLNIEIYDTVSQNFEFLNGFTCLTTQEFLFLDEDDYFFTAPHQGEVILYRMNKKNPLDYEIFLQKDMLSFSNL